jgi:hypothetical protein
VSDHLDAPGLKWPNMDVRVDITDIFAFQNPADPTRSFLAMSLFTGVRGIDFLGTSPFGPSANFAKCDAISRLCSLSGVCCKRHTARGRRVKAQDSYLSSF